MNPNVNQSIATMKERTEEMLKMWNLPGVSAALIKDGEVVFCDGFGSRDVAKQITARDLMSHRTGMAKYDAHAVFCTLELGLNDGAVCGIAIVFEPTPGVDPIVFT